VDCFNQQFGMPRARPPQVDDHPKQGIKIMFRKKDTGKSRQLLEGIDLTTLVHGEKTLMGQFKIAKGSAIPAHSHPHEQTGIMISGKLRFNVDGKIMDVVPGDSWCLLGGVEHSVEALEDSVVVEVFSPVREDYLP
jgi:quercetin dioxygenase-like cupin family protein